MNPSSSESESACAVLLLVVVVIVVVVVVAAVAVVTSLGRAGTGIKDSTVVAGGSLLASELDNNVLVLREPCMLRG